MKKSKKQEQESATPVELPASEPQAAVAPSILPVELIDITSIDYVVDNHRPMMDDAKLKELSESIRVRGVRQPIKVCRRDDRHVMVFGHRRVKASEMADLTTIPAMIAVDLTDQQIAEEQCIENIHREDVGPIGEAFAVKTLLDGGRTMDAVASMLNQPVAWCHVRFKLTRLDHEVQKLVNAGRLPLGHAIEISKVGEPDKQIELAEHAIGCHDLNRKADRDEAIADDYLEPLSQVRKTIQYYLCKMGNAGWPKDVEYADRRPCVACPDNSNTEPGLFENIGLTSSKGNCSNAACFECKSKAWEKDPIKVARDKEREQQKAAKGVPSDSGKGPKGEDHAARKKRIAALKKSFPWTPDQRFAVAAWNYGVKAAELVGQQLKKKAPESAQYVVPFLAISGHQIYLDSKDEKMLPSVKALLDGGKFSGPCLAMLWSKAIRFPDHSGPRINYNGDVEGVPLHESWVNMIANIVQIANAWKIKLPDPPKASDFAYEADISNADFVSSEDRDIIINGKKPGALAAILRVDLTMLQSIDIGELKGDWRRSAVKTRIAKLRKQAK